MIRLWLALLLVYGLCPAGNLYVFLPTYAKPSQIEKDLSVKIPSAKVQVFGRFSDFKAMIEKSPPAAVVAPLATLTAMGLLPKVVLTGTIKGKTDEGMALVAQGTAVTAADLNGKSVGMVSILERPEMKKTLESALAVKPKPNFATKLEDLLPMLTFQSANALLVTSSQAEDFQSRTQSVLAITQLPSLRQGNVAVAVLSSDGIKTGSEIEKLPSAALKLLNVEGWKK